MKRIFPLLFLIIILISCSRSDDEIINNENSGPLVTKMSSLVLYPYSFPYNNADLVFNFEYDSQTLLTKKTGGFLQVSGSSGFGGFFTDKIYTTLIYVNNKVTVENFSSSPDFTVPEKFNILYIK